MARDETARRWDLATPNTSRHREPSKNAMPQVSSSCGPPSRDSALPSKTSEYLSRAWEFEINRTEVKGLRTEWENQDRSKARHLSSCQLWAKPGYERSLGTPVAIPRIRTCLAQSVSTFFFTQSSVMGDARLWSTTGTLGAPAKQGLSISPAFSSVLLRCPAHGVRAFLADVVQLFAELGFLTD